MMIRRCLKTRTVRGRGTAMVEMALISPLLLILVFGIIQVAYLMFVRHLMHMATHEAVRGMIVVSNRSHAKDVVARDAFERVMSAKYGGNTSKVWSDFVPVFVPAPAPAEGVAQPEILAARAWVFTARPDVFLVGPVIPGMDAIENLQTFYMMAHEGPPPAEGP